MSTRADYYENPALYGLRRSTRAHNPPERIMDEYSSESDTPKRTRKKSKASTNTTKTKKKRKEDDFYDDSMVISDPEQNEEDEEDEDVYASSKKARLQELAKKKKKRKLASNSEEESSGVYTPPMRFSTRNSKVVNYNIDNHDDDADLMETDEEALNTYQDYEPEQQSGMILNPPYTGILIIFFSQF